MPGLNQTGQMGQGPMTGFRMGRCSKFVANFKNETTDSIERPVKNQTENFPDNGFSSGEGREFGRGFGRGHGMGRQNRFRDGS